MLYAGSSDTTDDDNDVGEGDIDGVRCGSLVLSILVVSQGNNPYPQSSFQIAQYVSYLLS